MPNTVRLHRVLATTPEKVYRAFLEADALAKWLPACRALRPRDARGAGRIGDATSRSEPSGREIETDQNLGHSGLTPWGGSIQGARAKEESDTLLPTRGGDHWKR